MLFQNDNIDQLFKNINKIDKRSYLRYSTNKNEILIEVEIMENTSGKTITAKGNVINISRNGVLIILNVKYLDIAQFVKFKILLNNPNIAFEDTGRIMWGMETENLMYYGIKLENLNIPVSSNDFYQYMYDNGLIYKK